MANQKYHLFAAKERLFLKDLKCPSQFRERLIGLVWRQFYKTQNKDFIQSHPIYHFTYKNRDGQYFNDFCIIPLDNWLRDALPFTPTFITLNTQIDSIISLDFLTNKDTDRYILFSNGMNDTLLKQIVLNANKGEFIAEYNTKELICTSKQLPTSLNHYDMGTVLKKAKHNHNIIKKIKKMNTFEICCLAYTIEKFIIYCDDYVKRQTGANYQCQILRNELLAATWDPRYFFQWCLDEQEKKEIRQRWNN